MLKYADISEYLPCHCLHGIAQGTKNSSIFIHPDMKGTLSLFLFIRMQTHVVLSVTHLASSPPAKTNMFPERVPFQKKSGLPKLSHFFVIIFSFRGRDIFY